MSNILHRCSHGISYTDIRLVNNAWAHHATRFSKHKLLKGFQRVILLHILNDNSDRKQQTLTGEHTTHTNGTIFQIQTDNAIERFNKERNDKRHFMTITKKVSPLPNTTYNPTKQDNHIKWALKRYCMGISKCYR